MEVDYSQYYYNRKPEKRQTNWGRLAVILITVACFVAFVLIYNAMHGGETGEVYARGGKVVITEKNFYAVQMGGFSSKSTAESFATGVVGRGGGGYVWNSRGTYYVIAAVYVERSDADSVAGKLSSSGETAGVATMKIPSREITVSDAEYSAKCIREFYSVCDELTELAVAGGAGSSSAESLAGRLSGLDGDFGEFFVSAEETIRAATSAQASKYAAAKIIADFIIYLEAL